MVPSTMRFETSSRSAIAASASSWRDMRQQLSDDFVGVDAVGLGLEVDEDAVAQHRKRDGGDVGEGDDGAAFEQSARFGAEQQRLAGARAGAPAHPLPDELGGFLAGRPRR